MRGSLILWIISGIIVGAACSGCTCSFFFSEGDCARRDADDRLVVEINESRIAARSNDAKAAKHFVVLLKEAIGDDRPFEDSLQSSLSSPPVRRPSERSPATSIWAFQVAARAGNVAG